jgi:ribonuclease T1
VALLVAALAGGIERCGHGAPVAPPPTTAPAPVQAAPAAAADRIPLVGGGAIDDPVEVREIRRTLEAIRRGPPWPYGRQDNEIFENRRRNLPEQRRGYWRDWTVRTPSEDDRGPRRLVLGDGGEVYFTRDHYASFVRLDVPDPR